MKVGKMFIRSDRHRPLSRRWSVLKLNPTPQILLLSYPQHHVGVILFPLPSTCGRPVLVIARSIHAWDAGQPFSMKPPPLVSQTGATSDLSRSRLTISCSFECYELSDRTSKTGGDEWLSISSCSSDSAIISLQSSVHRPVFPHHQRHDTMTALLGNSSHDGFQKRP
jgi:hypothetical protein